jgi:hypothetical protein
MHVGNAGDNQACAACGQIFKQRHLGRCDPTLFIGASVIRGRPDKTVWHFKFSDFHRLKQNVHTHSAGPCFSADPNPAVINVSGKKRSSDIAKRS